MWRMYTCEQLHHLLSSPRSCFAYSNGGCSSKKLIAPDVGFGNGRTHLQQMQQLQGNGLILPVNRANEKLCRSIEDQGSRKYERQETAAAIMTAAWRSDKPLILGPNVVCATMAAAKNFNYMQCRQLRCNPKCWKQIANTESQLQKAKRKFRFSGCSENKKWQNIRIPYFRPVPRIPFMWSHSTTLFLPENQRMSLSQKSHRAPSIKVSRLRKYTIKPKCMPKITRPMSTEDSKPPNSTKPTSNDKDLLQSSNAVKEETKTLVNFKFVVSKILEVLSKPSNNDGNEKKRMRIKLLETVPNSIKSEPGLGKRSCSTHEEEKSEPDKQPLCSRKSSKSLQKTKRVVTKAIPQSDMIYDIPKLFYNSFEECPTKPKGRKYCQNKNPPTAALNKKVDKRSLGATNTKIVSRKIRDSLNNTPSQDPSDYLIPSRKLFDKVKKTTMRQWSWDSEPSQQFKDESKRLQNWKNLYTYKVPKITGLESLKHQTGTANKAKQYSRDIQERNRLRNKLIRQAKYEQQIKCCQDPKRYKKRNRNDVKPENRENTRKKFSKSSKDAIDASPGTRILSDDKAKIENYMNDLDIKETYMKHRWLDTIKEFWKNKNMELWDEARNSKCKKQTENVETKYGHDLYKYRNKTRQLELQCTNVLGEFQDDMDDKLLDEDDEANLENCNSDAGEEILNRSKLNDQNKEWEEVVEESEEPVSDIVEKKNSISTNTKNVGVGEMLKICKNKILNRKGRDMSTTILAIEDQLNMQREEEETLERQPGDKVINQGEFGKKALGKKCEDKETQTLSKTCKEDDLRKIREAEGLKVKWEETACKKECEEEALQEKYVEEALQENYDKENKMKERKFEKEELQITNQKEEFGDKIQLEQNSKKEELKEKCEKEALKEKCAEVELKEKCAKETLQRKCEVEEVKGKCEKEVLKEMCKEGVLKGQLVEDLLKGKYEEESVKGSNEEVQKSKYQVKAQEEECEEKLKDKSEKEALQEKSKIEALKEKSKIEALKEKCADAALKGKCEKEELKRKCEKDTLKGKCTDEAPKGKCKVNGFKQKCEAESLRVKFGEEALKEQCEITFRQRCEKEALRLKYEEEEEFKRKCEEESIKRKCQRAFKGKYEEKIKRKSPEQDWYIICEKFIKQEICTLQKLKQKCMELKWKNNLVYNQQASAGEMSDIGSAIISEIKQIIKRCETLHRRYDKWLIDRISKGQYGKLQVQNKGQSEGEKTGNKKEEIKRKNSLEGNDNCSLKYMTIAEYDSKCGLLQMPSAEKWRSTIGMGNAGTLHRLTNKTFLWKLMHNLPLGEAEKGVGLQLTLDRIAALIQCLKSKRAHILDTQPVSGSRGCIIGEPEERSPVAWPNIQPDESVHSDRMRLDSVRKLWLCSRIKHGQNFRSQVWQLLLCRMGCQQMLSEYQRRQLSQLSQLLLTAPSAWMLYQIACPWL